MSQAAPNIEIVEFVPTGMEKARSVAPVDNRMKFSRRMTQGSVKLSEGPIT